MATLWHALTRRQFSWLDVIIFLVLYSVADSLARQYHWLLWPFAVAGVLWGASRSLLALRGGTQSHQ